MIRVSLLEQHLIFMQEILQMMEARDYWTWALEVFIPSTKIMEGSPRKDDLRTNAIVHIFAAEIKKIFGIRRHRESSLFYEYEKCNIYRHE